MLGSELAEKLPPLVFPFPEQCPSSHPEALMPSSRGKSSLHFTCIQDSLPFPLLLGTWPLTEPSGREDHHAALPLVLLDDIRFSSFSLVLLFLSLR